MGLYERLWLGGGALLVGRVVRYLKEGLDLVRLEGQWGAVNKAGKEILSCCALLKRK